MNTENKMEQMSKRLAVSTLAFQVRSHARQLEKYKDELFPCRKTVMVDCDRYRGLGVATRWDGCPADQLPVMLPNGNTWFYPVEACHPVPLEQLKNLPRSERRNVLRARGKRVL